MIRRRFLAACGAAFAVAVWPWRQAQAAPEQPDLVDYRGKTTLPDLQGGFEIPPEHREELRRWQEYEIPGWARLEAEGRTVSQLSP
jgi:hypothetical protein